MTNDVIRLIHLVSGIVSFLKLPINVHLRLHLLLFRPHLLRRLGPGMEGRMVHTRADWARWSTLSSPKARPCRRCGGYTLRADTAPESPAMVGGPLLVIRLTTSSSTARRTGPGKTSTKCRGRCAPISRNTHGKRRVQARRVRNRFLPFRVHRPRDRLNS